MEKKIELTLFNNSLCRSSLEVHWGQADLGEEEVVDGLTYEVLVTPLADLELGELVQLSIYLNHRYLIQMYVFFSVN